ncbi:MAG: hypothetical protein AABY30_03500, partial [Candidatus Thermoplasmatota archaeon]
GLPGTGPFQPPVAGTLYCDPAPVGTRLSFSFRAGFGTFDAVENSVGLIGIALPTAKIPRARVLWENGALLVVQPDGALVWDYPYFLIDRLADGLAVTYRAVRIGGESWSVVSTGTEIVNVRTLAPESIVLNVTGRGDADLDDVRQFVRDLKQEIRDVSTDGSGRLTGSYADDPPSEGILNQGLTEQLVYYDNAEAKQRIPDCEGASNDMNASARQLLLNVMDKILEGIDTGYIDPDYGLDLHTRMGNLLRCLDEMSGSLKEDCTFKCASLFGGSGGRLEFLFSSEQRDAWRRWFAAYFRDRGLAADEWDIEVRDTFVLVTLDGVRRLSFEAAWVTVR